MDHNERVRVRAYRIWQEEGRPEGRAAVHWEKARELVAVEDSLTAEKPPTDEEFGARGQPIQPIHAVGSDEIPQSLWNLPEVVPSVPPLGPAPKPRGWVLVVGCTLVLAAGAIMLGITNGQ